VPQPGYLLARLPIAEVMTFIAFGLKMAF